MNELMPCPFCGGKPIHKQFVQCPNLDCPLTDSFTIKEWNTRSSPPTHLSKDEVGDKERLDWLDGKERLNQTLVHCSNPQEGQYGYWLKGSGIPHPFKHIREAIDAAIAAERGGK